MVQMNFMPADVLEHYKEITAIPLSLNNARQLAGLPLSNGRRIKDGLLLRTTQLMEATEEDLRKLQEDYHLSLILDMRDESENVRMPDPEIPGAHRIAVPIIDFNFIKESMAARFQSHVDEIPGNDIDPEHPDPEKVMDVMIYMARKSREEKEDYMGMGGGAYAMYVASPFGQKHLGKFFHELAANDSGAVLWHCFTGKDRTGIASGLILEVLGADWETIAIDYEISNLYFAENVAKVEQALRAKGVEDDIIAQMCGTMAGVYLPMLENAWKYMKEAWGGPIGYLTGACGVTEEELETIRERYSEPA